MKKYAKGVVFLVIFLMMTSKVLAEENYGGPPEPEVANNRITGYAYELAASQYRTRSGILKIDGWGMISNWGIIFPVGDGKSGVTGLKLDYWSFHSPHGKWTRGNNEMDLTSALLGNANIYGYNITYEIGVAFFDLNRVFRWSGEDLIQPYAEVQFPIIKDEKKPGQDRLYAYTRLEAALRVDGKNNLYSLTPYGGVMYGHNFDWIDFTLEVALVGNDGRFDGHSGATVTVGPSLETPIWKGFSLITSGRGTVNITGNEKRDTGVTGYIGLFRQF